MNGRDQFDGLDDEKTVRVETCGSKISVIVKGRVYMGTVKSLMKTMKREIG